MGIEERINYQLNKYPGVKKVVKSVYQHAMYTVSPKIKSEGKITRISPKDSRHEYFFGYYDKSPWDAGDRYMLCVRALDTWSSVSPRAKADILLIDTKLPEKDRHRIRKIGETHSWNVQQSCMLQWLGPDFSSRILYNDFRQGNYVSVIRDIESKEERVIDMPVYTVAADGKTALTLDFSRLYNLRPGYGYYNVPERTKGIGLPDAAAVWKVDLESGKAAPLLTYRDFASFKPRPEMQESASVHKVNHLMLSPDGKRFMVLYRWLIGERKYSRLITCNTDGTDMYLLSDDDMVSHCFWKDDRHILAFENKKDVGIGYYLMTDKTQEYQHCWPELTSDGHPSYSPDRSCIVTDSYPDRARIQCLRVMKDENTRPQIVARVFSPFKYDNDTRCDLHPRWNHAGDKVCIDSVFEGHRGLYVVDVSEFSFPVLKKEAVKEIKEAPKYSIVTPVYNSFSLMTRYFQSLAAQTYDNFEVIIVDDCSTDHSYDLLKEYAEKSPLTISVYKTEKNRGPGEARNIGMDAARGEWITFIDNDDWVDPHLLEEIEAVLAETDCESIIYDFYNTDGNTCRSSSSMYSGQRGPVSLSDCVKYMRNHTFGKFYKLSKCRQKGVRFPDLRRCEDVAFGIRAVIACGSAYYLDKPLYYYFQRTDSLSNNKQLDESDMVKAFSAVEEDLSAAYPEELMEKSVTDILYGAVLMMSKAGKSNREIKTYIRRYERKYKGWQRCEIIHHLGKAKRVFLTAVRYRQIWLLKLLAYAHGKMIG